MHRRAKAGPHPLNKSKCDTALGVRTLKTVKGCQSQRLKVGNCRRISAPAFMELCMHTARTRAAQRGRRAGDPRCCGCVQAAWVQAEATAHQAGVQRDVEERQAPVWRDGDMAHGRDVLALHHPVHDVEPVDR